jgi:hypothetical protein
MKERHALATSLTVLAHVGMTVPKDGAVVVPHGSTVVSHEDVNVDVGSNEVRSVDKNGFPRLPQRLRNWASSIRTTLRQDTLGCSCR